MIWHNVEQGTEEWLRLRSGIPTASEFKKIITPKTIKLSSQADGYMNVLLYEWMVGHPFTGPETEWMTRGIELESEAVSAYEFQAEVETEPPGFFTTDDGLVGASPDRLIGKDRLLEIKCPAPATHVGYMLTKEVESDYLTQLQGQLWVSERKRVDIVSYHPEMPAVVIPVDRDEEYIGKLSSAVRQFVDVMLERRLELERRFGPFVRPEPQREAEVGASLGFEPGDLEALIESKFPKGEN